MELRRHGKLVKWAYWFETRRNLDMWNAPDRTSLCAFFWRAFVLMPLLWGLIVAGGLLLAATAGFIAWDHPLVVSAAAAVVIGLVVVNRLGRRKPAVARLADWADDRIYVAVARAGSRVRHSVFVQGLKALKAKACPIIEIKE